MGEVTKVLLANRDPLWQIGLKTVLTGEEDLTIVGETRDSSYLQALNRKLQPNLLILDLDLPNLERDLFTYLSNSSTQLRVLGVANESELNLEILKISIVAGCILKCEEPQILVNAVRVVAKGKKWYSQEIAAKLVKQNTYTITDREREVLELIAQGFDNTAIAEQLKLAKQTVGNYISRIYDTLEFKSRAEAVVWAREHGFTQKR